MEAKPGPASASLSPELAAFLQQHPALQPGHDNRVKCSLTGHELPCRLADLQAYTKGKKYQRLSMKEPFNYSQYEPHIVPSTKNPQQLFCKLTIRHINKIPQHILRHVNGKRYQRALKKFNECTALGVPFVPACLSQKKKRNRESNREEPYHNQKTFWAPDESEGSESDNSDDSMSDLYPEHLFSRKDDSRTELLLNKGHSDSEKMEVETQLPRKRKKTHPHPFTKKKLKEGAPQRPNSRGKFKTSQKAGNRN
ncbi:surfeit locus protein 2-like [Carcharodon carcharias]|uniref:surfeit locus protein 2-like n=1 Tax=Carcharodon carcharias TaxID=13397 RepID=UPI001B7F3E08|nr:surfeit locus protein 2-like [Carcharodon carcharias]